MLFNNRYQLQDTIRRGGMATVYRGRDLHEDRIVAIKVLSEAHSTNAELATNFQEGAKMASSLLHPNIVQVYDYGEVEGNYFLVMEYIEGIDLRHYLRARGMLAVDRANIIAHDVALGLGAAHQRGIIHCNMKLQNIQVGRNGTIKLTDLGMSWGIRQYYAPEQLEGGIVGPTSDVYALGNILYEMLSGRALFDGDTPVAVAMQHIHAKPVPPSVYNPNIPPALEEIMLRCLEKAPEKRYSNGSTLASALETIIETRDSPPNSNENIIMSRPPPRIKLPHLEEIREWSVVTVQYEPPPSKHLHVGIRINRSEWVHCFACHIAPKVASVVAESVARGEITLTDILAMSPYAHYRIPAVWDMIIAERNMS